MTSGNGPLESLSPTDVEKILAKFMEYAIVNKRDISVKAINDNGDGGQGRDADKFEHFRALFGPVSKPGDDSSAVENTTSKKDNRNVSDVADFMNDAIDEEAEELKARILEEKRYYTHCIY